MQGVYRIRNKVSGKCYIGSSKSIKGRWAEHRRGLRKGEHHCIYLQWAWNKYGKSNFVFEIVEKVIGDCKRLLSREQVYLDEGFDKGILYNIAKDAASPMHGREAWNKGKSISSQHRENTRLGILKYYETHDGWNKGIPRSEICKRRISKSLEGHTAWNKGIKTGPRSKEENLERVEKMQENDTLGQLYPAFFNVRTGQYIPAGRNLKQMCSDYKLSYYVFTDVDLERTKMTRDGWRIANEGDI